MRSITTWLAALAGAGYGLLMWCGMTTAVLHLRAPDALPLQQLQVAGLALGILLVAIGLVADLQTRPISALTSPDGPWRTRAIVAATLLMAIVLVVALYGRTGGRASMPLAALGGLQTLLAFAAVALSVPASLRARPLRVPIRLLFAMTTGLALLYLLMDRLLGAGSDGRLMLATLLGLGSVLAICHGADRFTRTTAFGANGGLRCGRAARVPALLVGGPAFATALAITGTGSPVVLLALAGLALIAAHALDLSELTFAAAGPDRAIRHGT